jgi:hypothetical protein
MMNKTIVKTKKDFVVLREASIKSKYFIYNDDVEEFYSSDGITPISFESKAMALRNALEDGDLVCSYSQLPDHIKMFLR